MFQHAALFPLDPWIISILRMEKCSLRIGSLEKSFYIWDLLSCVWTEERFFGRSAIQRASLERPNTPRVVQKSPPLTFFIFLYYPKAVGVEVLPDLSDPSEFSSVYNVINFPLSAMSENVKRPPATTIRTIGEGCKSEHLFVWCPLFLPSPEACLLSLLHQERLLFLLYACSIRGIVLWKHSPNRSETIVKITIIIGWNTKIRSLQLNFQPWPVVGLQQKCQWLSSNQHLG